MGEGWEHIENKPQRCLMSIPFVRFSSSFIFNVNDLHKKAVTPSWHIVNLHVICYEATMTCGILGQKVIDFRLI